MCFSISQTEEMPFSGADSAFLDYKTATSKCRKICIFPKGFLYGFGQKF